jgi:hypothetical protein
VTDAGLVSAVAAGATTITITATQQGVATPVTATVPVNVLGVTSALERNTWTVTESSTLNDNAKAINLFDGDLASIWHSAADATMPQSFTIDMQGYRQINGFFYYNRQGETGNNRAYPKNYTIATSLTGEDNDWTTVYTSTDAVMKELRVALPLQNQVVARYVKVTVTSTANGANWTYLSEFGAYNTAEPLPAATNIVLNAPAVGISQSTADPLTFSWDADDPAPAAFTLKLSKNQDMSSATEFPVTGATSKQVSTNDLSTILGTDASVPIYWTVSAEGFTTPAARSFTLVASITPITLVNAVPPFAGEPADHTWGDGAYLQALTGWTHENNLRISLSFADGPEGKISMFSYPLAGIPYVTNGKVYQGVNLQAGYYELTFDCAGIDGNAGVVAYGVVTKAAALPNYDVVGTDNDVLGSIYLPNYQNNVAIISFTLNAAATVQLGWVYNTSETGHGYQNFKLNSLSLVKIGN